MSKMTDEQIIKALECCIKHDCGECCLIDYSNDADVCQTKHMKETLDLINRQQAELDDLKRDTIPKLQDSLKRANKYGLETDKENEQLKAEIERLQKENEELGKAIAGAYELNCFLEASKKCVRNEAYNEFAERLKEDIRKSWYYNLCEAKDEEKAFKEIDNLVKEMVGEGK